MEDNFSTIIVLVPAVQQRESVLGMCVYPPALESSSHPSPSTPPLSVITECWAGLPVAIQQLPTSCFTHGSFYVSATLSVRPTVSLPRCIHKSVLCVCISILPCRQLHEFHFSRFHTYALIYDVCVSLSDLGHSV